MRFDHPHRMAGISSKHGRRTLYQMLISLARPISHTGQDDPRCSALELLSGHFGTIRKRSPRGLNFLPPCAFPPRLVPDNALKCTSHNSLVFGEVVNHGVWAGVERIRTVLLPFWMTGIDVLTYTYSSSARVVHVEDGWIGVEAGGVEVVRVLCGQLGEALKVPVVNGLFHGLHSLGYHLVCSMLEQSRAGNSLLHAGRRTDILLLGAGYEDDSSHVRPVGGRGDFIREAVAAICLLSFLPGNVSAHQAAACRARALSGDAGEIGGRGGQLIQVGNGPNEGSESSSRGGQARSSREVVLTDNLQLQLRQLRQRRVGVLDRFSQ